MAARGGLARPGITRPNVAPAMPTISKPAQVTRAPANPNGGRSVQFESQNDAMITKMKSIPRRKRKAVVAGKKIFIQENDVHNDGVYFLFENEEASGNSEISMEFSLTGYGIICYALQNPDEGNDR